MKRLLEGVLVGIALLAGGAVAQSGAEVSLRAAIEQETVKGDLKGAIEQYNKILAQKSTPRPVAARALFQLGQCEEKLGQAEARKAYERLVQEYGDQPELVAQARAKLAGMGGGAAGESGVKAVQVWEGAQGVNTNGISHDGRYIAYVLSGTKVAVHDLQSGTDRKVAGGDSGLNVLLPVFTPDDKHIVYSWRDTGAGEIRIVALDGSGERTILRMGDTNTVPGVVSPDGKLVAAQLFLGGGKGNQLALISLDTGEVRILKTLQSMDLRIGNFSPDGRWLVYSPIGTEGRATYVIATDGSSETRLVPAGAVVGAAFYTPDGLRVVFVGRRDGRNELWTVRMSGGKPLNAPEPAGPAVGDEADLIGFAKDGSLFFNRSVSLQSVYVAEVDLTQGKLKTAPRLVSDPLQDFSTFAPAWSADGKSLAYVSRRPSMTGAGEATFVIRGLESSERKTVSANFAQLAMATQFFWAPEGKALYLSGAGCRALDIATGRVSELLDKNVQCGSGAVGSPDNRAIYYYTRATQGQVSAANPRRIIRHDTKTEQETEVYRNEDSGISNLSLSPDGRYLALVANPMTYWAIPVAGGEPVKIPVPNAAGGWMQGPIAWTPDSRAVVFARRDQQSRQTEIWVQPISGGKARPTGLAAKGISGVSNILPDGRIAYTASESSYAVWAIRSLFTESRNK